MTNLPAAPVAERHPHSFTHHGITIEDPYAWLRDPNYPDVNDPAVLAYLNAENAYFEAAMAPHQPLVETLFKEMRGRIKEADASVPQKDGDWLYWRSFDEGAQYRKWWRAPVAGGEQQLILDEPLLAEGKEYFRLGGMDVSPDDRLLAFAIDDDGSERFTIRIKNLETGELLPDVIEGTLGGFLFAGEGQSLLYGLVNEHWRIDVAKLHRLGTPVDQDVELYRESDEGFQVGLGLTQSRRWITISTGDHVTSEIRLVPFEDPLATPIMVSPRQPGREYEVEEHDGTLFIRTNDTHTNFRLVTAAVERPGEWTERIAPSADFYLTDVTTFADFFVVEGREHGLDRIYLHDYAGGPGKQIDFPEASYSAGLDDNPEYQVTKLRLSYESMVTPGTVLDLDLATDERTILKVQEIPSGYDPSLYATERLEITVRDGTKVPVSIVYKRGFERPGPLYLYGYGAYGLAIEPGFSTSRLSLLDRGMAFAIAHIRGGDDLGQQWYLDGKLQKRTNTFHDFIDVARGLVAQGWTEAGRIAIAGGSAGGELMGAVINEAPELWGAVAAHVPFVDVLNTMLDPTLPLTPGEWPEWGNPIEDRDAFELIRSYSPYDNVGAQAYPPLLVTAGLNDPRVTYWEPAKWVAKLRATKTDQNILLLKTNMGAGHGGKSGRFESLRETAEEFAFILWQLGLDS
ncbi:S9 family peptidase [Sphingomonas sp. ID1715]|uniref:S9 family peptidase n=1 Tax=Sphingomonas sp. ID1715 TaxID=1656898 RepID=UPI0014880560|nr:S9 family peptidase [Sphingomonas sp. ID1715]NNM76969.1 S9 family peptidase [Sphingomonas sp. ID1715]